MSLIAADRSRFMKSLIMHRLLDAWVGKLDVNGNVSCCFNKNMHRNIGY